MKKALIWILAIIFALLVTGVIYLKLVHGGGTPYPDVSTSPIVPDSRFDQYIELEYPPGMVTVSPDNRLFFSYHMLHQPERFNDATIFEWINNESIPFPNIEEQEKFNGAMGVVTDTHNRLWIIVPGTDRKPFTKLYAYDINSKELLVDHKFPDGTALFSQDMRVSPDGNTVYLADTGLFKFKPGSIIVFDVKKKSSRILLEGHESVSPQNWVIRKQNGELNKLFFGLITWSVGVDGIALTHDGEWLYYATMTHDSAYRVRTEYLQDTTLSADELATKVEFVGHKPMSDAVELDKDNNLIITDVENGGLAMLTPDGELSTLVKKPEINWADSVTVAQDGTIYFTDSHLTSLMDSTMSAAELSKIKATGPYFIYRISPVAEK